MTVMTQKITFLGKYLIPSLCLFASSLVCFLFCWCLKEDLCLLTPTIEILLHFWRTLLNKCKSGIKSYRLFLSSIYRYLNDLYVIDIRGSNNLQWEVPSMFGMTPSPRESHTCVAMSDSDNKRPRLIVYGGMSGCRLGDLHQLDIGEWICSYTKFDPTHLIFTNENSKSTIELVGMLQWEIIYLYVINVGV